MGRMTHGATLVWHSGIDGHLGDEYPVMDRRTALMGIAQRHQQTVQFLEKAAQGSHADEVSTSTVIKRITIGLEIEEISIFMSRIQR